MSEHLSGRTYQINERVTLYSRTPGYVSISRPRKYSENLEGYVSQD